MSNHIPVMEQECLKGFEGVHLEVVLDGTVGAGGHAAAILQAHPEVKRYIGCDRDPEALRIAGERLLPWQEKVELVLGNFSGLDTLLEERGIAQVDGFFLT